MFTADALLDAVRTGKKTFVSTFVTNETIKDSLVKFIDAQAEMTKKAAKLGVDTFTTLSSEAVKQAQEATKFDFNKAYTEMAEKFSFKK